MQRYWKFYFLLAAMQQMWSKNFIATATTNLEICALKNLKWYVIFRIMAAICCSLQGINS